MTIGESEVTMNPSVTDNKGMKLCGARVWARWQLTGTPLFDLWEYIGPQQHAGQEVHRFQSFKPAYYPPIVMFMTMGQLTFNAKHFRPFCIDTKEV